MLVKYKQLVSVSNILRSTVIKLAAVMCLLPAIASADTIFGLHGSAHLWQPELGGSIGQSNDAFDFSSEFSDNKGTSNSILVAVEHPIPLIPNLQVRQTPLTWTGTSESASGTLGGLASLSGVAASAELEMTFLDGTIYYEILDNWVSVDLGLTARQFDGYVKVSETGGLLSDRVDIKQILPMGYVHARFDLPFSGLAVGLRGNGIVYKDNNLLDIEAYVHLEVDLIPLLDVGVQGGIRRMSLGIDDIDDWSSEATLNGAYIALTGHF